MRLTCFEKMKERVSGTGESQALEHKSANTKAVNSLSPQADWNYEGDVGTHTVLIS
jgi:hypothetical protein